MLIYYVGFLWAELSTNERFDIYKEVNGLDLTSIEFRIQICCLVCLN